VTACCGLWLVNLETHLKLEIVMMHFCERVGDVGARVCKVPWPPMISMMSPFLASCFLWDILQTFISVLLPFLQRVLNMTWKNFSYFCNAEAVLANPFALVLPTLTIYVVLEYSANTKSFLRQVAGYKELLPHPKIGHFSRGLWYV
jgi:hypothetical protein